MSNLTKTKNFKTSSIIKFFLLSLFGIFSFFIKFPLNGTNSILIDHIVTLLKPFLEPNYITMMFLFGLFCILDTFFIKKSWNKNVISKVLAVVTTLGAIFAAMTFFKIGPSWFLAEDIGPTASILNGVASITVIVAGLFIPFLVDFGLVDAAGVLLRPIMKPLFKVPGRASVIAISAFLGNFSVGHISTNALYKEGKFNQREAAIIALGFCTPSIGIMLLFTNLLDMMQYWNLIFASSIAVTLIVTFITIRIYPLRNKSLDYCENVIPDPEPKISEKLLINAYYAGVSTAESSGSILKNLGTTFIFTLRVVTNMMITGVFVLTIGLLLNKYTPIFSYTGYIFWPFFKIAGFDNIDVLMKCASMSFLDMYLSVLNCVGQNLSLGSKFFACLYPMTVSIFLSGFWPVVLSTDLPVKPLDLVASWFLRMVLSIILIGILAVILF